MNNLAKSKSSDIKKALAKRDLVKRSTFGVYSINFKGNWNWTPPFLAPSDDIALKAVAQMVEKEPSLQRKNLYRIADFCAFTGDIKPIKGKRIIYGEVKTNEN